MHHAKCNADSHPNYKFIFNSAVLTLCKAQKSQWSSQLHAVVAIYSNKIITIFPSKRIIFTHPRYTAALRPA